MILWVPSISNGNLKKILDKGWSITIQIGIRCIKSFLQHTFWKQFPFQYTKCTKYGVMLQQYCFFCFSFKIIQLFVWKRRFFSSNSCIIGPCCSANSAIFSYCWPNIFSVSSTTESKRSSCNPLNELFPSSKYCSRHDIINRKGFFVQCMLHLWCYQCHGHPRYNNWHFHI